MLAPIHKITVNVMITNVHRLAYSTGKPTTTNRTATGNRIFQNGELTTGQVQNQVEYNLLQYILWLHT